MSELEKIIRPIVEGQIRGFLKEHPRIVEAVDWYKPRKDKAQTFVNSLAKRIVRDLTCGTSAARLAAALLAVVTEGQSKSSVEASDCGEPGPAGKVGPGRPRSIPKVNRPIRKEVRKQHSILRIPENEPLTPRLREKKISTEAIGFRFTPDEERG